MTSLRLPAASVATAVGSALAGMFAGALTCYLQGVLCADWNTAVNSGAVWTLVAFVLAAGLARTPTLAGVFGLLVLTGEVAGYYLYLADVRHLAAGHTAEVLWTMAALWIGPLTGLGAFCARWGSAAQRMAALAALAGVLAGEGGYLVRVADVPRAGWVELVLSALLATGALAARPAPLRVRGAALGTGVAVAVAVYLAYRLLAFG
jgi:hypothetical protein